MKEESKIKLAFLSGILLVIFLLIGLPVYFTQHKPVNNLPVVDTFYIYRDSVIKQIDTLVIERTKYQIQYEKQIETIDTQSVSADMQFFTEYLLQRFSSDNNSDTVKASE